MQLSSAQLGFLARLSKAPDGQLLLELLKARQVERDTSLRRATGEEVLRAQGRALELSEIIADITEAGSRLNRNVPTAAKLYRSVA